MRLVENWYVEYFLKIGGLDIEIYES